MNTIEVLLATSSDLDDDNLWFGDLIDQLNTIFNKRGINLSLVEHIDCVELEASPEDFDAKLADCEMCMVLHSNDITEARKEEFSKAYDEFMQGRNPRKIYVFFKDIKEEDLSESMKDFKRGFVNNFGHFYGVYENVDTLRLQFLLQFELYQNKGLGEKLLTVKNEKVQVYENDVVDLNNVAFARDNEKFKELKAQISELSIKISQKRKEIALDPENDKLFDEMSVLTGDKRELEKEYNAHQGFLFDMSLAFTKLATKELNETTNQAMELFEKGFADAADKLLNEEKMNADAENMRKKRANALEVLVESNKEYKAQINAFLAKRKTVMAVSTLSIKERVKSAYSAFESAIELAEEIDYDQEELASIYFDYADLLNAYAKYEKSLEYYIKALSIEEEVLGEKHPYTATTYNNIGAVYHKQSENKKSLEYYIKALSIEEEALGEKHPNAAATYSNIGAVYSDQGEYEKALEYYSKALSIEEEVLGEKHPYTATSYSNIGSVYDDQGENEKALEYYIKALSIEEEVLGEKHPDTATTYNNIGAVYHKQSEYEKALEYYSKALSIREEALGEKHPYTATTYNNIGAVYHKQMNDFYEKEDYLKAGECCEKIIVINKKLLGESSFELLMNYMHLAFLYYKQDRFDDSEKYFRIVIERGEVLLIQDPLNVKNYNSNIASSYAYLGVIYRKRAIYDNSEEYSLKALEMQEALYSDDSGNLYFKNELSTTCNDLAKLYETMGNLEKSEFYKQKADTLYKSEANNN